MRALRVNARVATLLTILLLGCGGANRAGAPSTGALADLDWMVGSWRQVEGDTINEEHWLPATGDLMLGVNRTVRTGPSPEADETVAFEFLRVERRDDGVYYVAAPGGGDETAFLRIDAPGEPQPRAVFVNPDHDFPTRITYWRTGEALNALVEGEGDGPVLTFLWRRIDDGLTTSDE